MEASTWMYIAEHCRTVGVHSTLYRRVFARPSPCPGLSISSLLFSSSGKRRDVSQTAGATSAQGDGEAAEDCAKVKRKVVHVTGAMRSTGGSGYAGALVAHLVTVKRWTVDHACHRRRPAVLRSYASEKDDASITMDYVRVAEKR